MSRVLHSSVLSVLTACYASHQPSGDRLDAAPADGGADVVRVDASARDAGVFAACPGGVELIDQQAIEWEPVDCGTATYPRALAVGGENGPFQLVITEERFCDDRPGVVWAHPVRVEGGRLRVGRAEGMGIAQGPAHVASNGDQFAACSGASLYIRSSGGEMLSELLRDPPVSEPGCPQGVTCLGLTHDGAGWGAIWDRFECDVSLPEISRSGPRGGLREAPFAAGGVMASIAPVPSGFASLARRREAATLYRWDRDASAPTVLSLNRVGESPSAVSPWPFVDGAWAVVFANDRTVGLRVFDERGRSILERDHPSELMGYAPISVRMATGSFGAVVGVGYGWTGGRIDTATRIVSFAGEGAEVIMDIADVDVGVGADAPIDVAVSDNYLLVHRVGRIGPGAGTEALLFSCL